MAELYLNKDKSILCELTKGKVLIGTNHTNQKNSQRLVSNISKIISVQEKSNKSIISLNNVPYVTVNNNGNIDYQNILTSF